MSRIVVFLLLLPSLAWPASRVFTDGFESGNSNLWTQDPLPRNKCNIVTAGVASGSPRTGTYAAECNWDQTLLWNDINRFLAMYRDFAVTNESFFRGYILLESDIGTQPLNNYMKLFRFQNPSDTAEIYGNPKNLASTFDFDFFILNYPSCWGCSSGMSKNTWIKIEMYVNAATGVIKIWFNDVLAYNETGSTLAVSRFQMSSNWSGADGCCDSDSTNHVMWDDIEIFSDDNGGDAITSGSMVNGDVASSGGGDTTPPVISNPLPSGTQAIGTTNVTLQVTTNENATCKYGSSDAAYASLPSTFSTTGGTTHQQSLAVSAGSYTRYVRCQDGSGNVNTSSTVIAFTIPVLAPPTNFDVTVQ